MTFWPAYKAMRSITAGQNVAEKNPTKGAARLGFFGARTASAVRIYSPVMCRLSVHLYSLFYINNYGANNSQLKKHIAFYNKKFFQPQ
jgi:hypothetical protein